MSNLEPIPVIKARIFAYQSVTKKLNEALEDESLDDELKEDYGDKVKIYNELLEGLEFNLNRQMDIQKHSE